MEVADPTPPTHPPPPPAPNPPRALSCWVRRDQPLWSERREREALFSRFPIVSPWRTVRYCWRSMTFLSTMPHVTDITPDDEFLDLYLLSHHWQRRPEGRSKRSVPEGRSFLVSHCCRPTDVFVLVQLLRGISRIPWVFERSHPNALASCHKGHSPHAVPPTKLTHTIWEGELPGPFALRPHRRTSVRKSRSMGLLFFSPSGRSHSGQQNSSWSPLWFE